jgi:hypothetical protein
MNGSGYHEEAAASRVAVGETDNEVVAETLTEVQRLAAERRAIAEDILAQAREFENQLANEREVLTALVAAAEGARAGESEAEAALRRARKKHAASITTREGVAQRGSELRRAQDEATAAVAEAQERLEIARRTLDAAIEARSNHEAAIDQNPVEVQTLAELNAALRALDERREARTHMEAEVAQMRARIELLSGTNGLSADAIKRVVERRIADRMRERADHR